MITTHVSLGSNVEYDMKEVICIYRGGDRTFATRNPALPDPQGGPPIIGAGTPITRRFLTTLSRAMKQQVAPEILPGNVLVRTDTEIVWWSPARTRVLFYTDQTDGDFSLLNGKTFPIPALVWRVRNRGLSIRALDESERPTAETPLRHVPLWNTYASGAVCMGNMRTPSVTSVDSLTGWEDGYFGSSFTHPNAHRQVTSHPKGFFALWHALIGKPRFPSRYLVDAEETLAEFVHGTKVLTRRAAPRNR